MNPLAQLTRRGIGQFLFIFAIGTASLSFIAPTWAESELKLPEGFKAEVATTSPEKLGSNDQGVGLIPGTKVEDFTVNNHEGEPVSFSALTAKSPLLVVFYRGGWCPYCNVQIKQLTEAYPAFSERGVLPVLISVDKPHAAALAQRTYEIPFPVLSDPELAAHTSFDVIMTVDDATVEQYKGYGIDLEAWSSQDHHKIAVSSAFIVDSDGVVQWAHTSMDYKTRPSVEQLLEMIDATELE